MFGKIGAALLAVILAVGTPVAQAADNNDQTTNVSLRDGRKGDRNKGGRDRGGRDRGSRNKGGRNKGGKKHGKKQHGKKGKKQHGKKGKKGNRRHRGTRRGSL